MDFSLLTIADCPNDAPAQELFARALQMEGVDPARLTVREVGSDAEPAVSCRVYRTGNGLKGQPDVAELQAAVRSAITG